MKPIPGKRYRMANGNKAIIDGERDGRYYGRAEIATGIWEPSLWLDLGENCYRSVYDLVEEWD
jgi:hypothetical protein